ncbi:DUF2178 domain-containing protein [Clostridium manihotivorum]|uniref:Uncharacterized protein n=1 Tax=Clostridium manihotivorum TaxID=2320868 RepID=A0A3R5X1L8_9CLOT|nr:DUF2178 domain-containing protein [Clostridium manihotivorum]QAA32097.1 hypothetical protein C1I91_10755 [Clostridium manihotivorum]
MEDNNQKKSDSILVGAIVWTILFLSIGFFKLIFTKEIDLLAFLLGSCSLIFLIYLLKKTKSNQNERYEDERKHYLSEKSSSISYEVIFLVIVVLSALVRSGKLVIGAADVLLIILCSALIIKFIAYLSVSTIKLIYV